MADATPQFKGWAILELMGHRQRAGYVEDVEMFGTRMARIDIAVSEGVTVTEYYGGSAIYALRPCTAELAKRHTRENYEGDPRPILPLDFKPRDPVDAPFRTDDPTDREEPFDDA